jgi:hypothetical protein
VRREVDEEHQDIYHSGSTIASPSPPPPPTTTTTNICSSTTGGQTGGRDTPTTTNNIHSSTTSSATAAHRALSLAQLIAHAKELAPPLALAPRWFKTMMGGAVVVVLFAVSEPFLFV